MIVQWLNIALNSLGRISIESLERVFPLKVRGVVSRRLKVGNTAGEYTVCGSSPQCWFTAYRWERVHNSKVLENILIFNFVFYAFSLKHFSEEI
jgi:hypothetical protein